MVVPMSEMVPEPDGATEQGQGRELVPTETPGHNDDQDGNDEVFSSADRIRQEEEDLLLRLDSLRKLRASRETTAGRDWFGGPVNRGGDNAKIYSAGRDMYTYITAEGAPPVRTVPLSADRVERLKSQLVVTESQKRLTELLIREPLVVLRGSRNTGRTTTAIAALLGVAKSCSRLMIGDNPARVGPENLEEGVGYVLRADKSAWTARLKEVVDHLSAVAANSRCHIVMLVDRDSGLLRQMVDHVPPDVEKVFRNTFAHLLCDPDAWDTHGLDSSHIHKQLSGARPADAARLAKDLAHGLGQNRTVDDVLKTQPLIIQARLREQLATDQTKFGRCFLVGSAVLHGLPEPLVSQSALDFAERILEHTKRKDEESDPDALWECLEKWLGDLGISTVEGDRPGEGRRVQLPDELARMLLPMIWEELPAIRDHLYAWLRQLGEHSDHRVQIKVAHAVGLLARRDFTLTEKEFLDGWSRSEAIGPKHLAAWALEVAADDLGIKNRVDTLLSRWSNCGLYQQKVTAAIAYGSPTGLWDIDQVLRSFREITLTTRSRLLCAAMAQSLTGVYREHTARPIIVELGRWARSERPGPRLTAALTLVRLGLSDRLPPLFDHADEADLIDLWIRSLDLSLSEDRTVKRRSDLARPLWDVLASWAREWNRCESRRTVIEGIFKASGRGSPRLRRVYQFHLVLWQRQGIISVPLSRHLNRMLKAG